MSPHTVLVDAHRGASVSHPENTVAAFRAALDAGVDSVEFDVRLSRDGKPVVIHDETVERTTSGEGEVGKLTLVELRDLDAGSWKAPRFAGERIPTLDETLDLLASAPRINIELKDENPRLVGITVEAIESRRLHHRIMVSSFHLQHLVAVKNRLPGVWTHLFLEHPLSHQFWSREGRFVNSFGVTRKHVTDALVTSFRGHGRAVWAWTVDDPREALGLAAVGVQAINTNDPVRIIEALEGGGYR
jgi:glycerophosphoryl diester phosphodiesterase